MLETDQPFASRFNFENATTPAQKAALVYQTVEQDLINTFAKVSRAKVLLPAHDGIYVKNAIDYISAWSQLTHDYIDDMLFVQFDHTKYISDVQAKESLTGEINHIKATEQYEKDASQYHSIWESGEPLSKKQVETQFGLIDEDIWNELNPLSDSEYYEESYCEDK